MPPHSHIHNSGQFQSEGDLWAGNQFNTSGGQINVNNPVTFTDQARAHIGDIFVQIGSRKRIRDNEEDENESKRRQYVRHDAAINLIKALTFPGIWHRHQSIATEYPGTCSWSLSPEESRTAFDNLSGYQGDDLQTNFINWLTSDDDFYWICGTAGAGKSTLLSFMINNQDQVKQKLETWADGHNSVVLSFFFWKFGTFMQKSICGMLRSLIIQLVQQIPSVVDIIAENQSSILSPDNQPWTKMKLEKVLAAAIEASGFRICIFIDALDEFHAYYGEANLSAHELALRETTRDLLATVQKIRTFPGVKVCVASRPGNVFDHAFSAQPHLDLQTINEKDIQKFTEGELGQIFPAQTAAEFTREIVWRSQGIFLWAKLVVKHIIEGFDNGDDVTELRTRMNELPSGLEEVYRRMFDRLDPRYLDDSVLLLCLIDFLDQRNPVFQSLVFVLFSRAVHVISRPDLLIQVQNFDPDTRWMKKVVQSRGGGFLEIRRSDFIETCCREIDDELDPELFEDFAMWAFDHDSTSKLVTLLNLKVVYIHRSAKEFIRHHLEPSLQRLADKVGFSTEFLNQYKIHDEKLPYAAGIIQCVVNGGLAFLQNAAVWRSRAHHPWDIDAMLLFESAVYSETILDFAPYVSSMHDIFDKYGMQLHCSRLRRFITSRFFDTTSRRQWRILNNDQPEHGGLPVIHFLYFQDPMFNSYTFHRIAEIQYLENRDVPVLLRAALQMLLESDQEDFDMEQEDLDMEQEDFDMEQVDFDFVTRVLQRLSRISRDGNVIKNTIMMCLEAFWSSGRLLRTQSTSADRFVLKIYEIIAQCPELINMTIEFSGNFVLRSESYPMKIHRGEHTLLAAIVLCIRPCAAENENEISSMVQSIIKQWPLRYRIHMIQVGNSNFVIRLTEEQSNYIMADLICPTWPFIQMGTMQQFLRYHGLAIYTLGRVSGLFAPDVSWLSFLNRLTRSSGVDEEGNNDKSENVSRYYLRCYCPLGFDSLRSAPCQENWHSCDRPHGSPDIWGWFMNALSEEELERVDVFNRFWMKHCSVSSYSEKSGEHCESKFVLTTDSPVMTF